MRRVVAVFEGAPFHSKAFGNGGLRCSLWSSLFVLPYADAQNCPYCVWADVALPRMALQVSLKISV